MSEYLSAEALTTIDLPEQDVTVAKGKVRIRGMSRKEVLQLDALRASKVIKDEAHAERWMLSRALLAPQMTEEQIGAWQGEKAGGDLETVTVALRDLSGLGKGAEKSGVPETGDGSDAGIRVLASGETMHDSRPVAAQPEQ